jgi:hypothetical protein
MTDRSGACSEGPAVTGSRRRDRWLAVLAVAVAIVPIVTALVRALSHHWVPLNDDAITAVRAYDVFSGPFPLLGTASSFSLLLPHPVNHPGPLQFLLLAVPEQLFGISSGVAIGSALLNVAAMAGIGWVGYRRGGLSGSLLATLVAGTLAWSMGSELLYDPWGPNALLLPTFLFLLAVWSTAAGDLAILPLAVFAGSFAMQTHLSASYLVPTFLLVGLLLGFRAVLRPGGWRWPVVAVAVGLLVWAPPLVEQVTTDSGNLGRLAAEVGKTPGRPVGATGAVRLVGDVLARPPFWLRDSMSTSLHRPGERGNATAGKVSQLDVPSPLDAGIRIAVVVGVLALLGILARRRGDRSVVMLTVLAGLGVAVAWFTAKGITTSITGVAPHQFRFLWPIAAFVTFAVLFAAVRSLHRPRLVSAVAGVLLVVVSVANLPYAAAGGGPQVDEWAIPTVRAIDRQLGAARSSAPILADWDGLRFGEPYSAAFTAELARRGIPFRFSPGYQVRQYGTDRRFAGGNARARIIYRDGPTAHRARLGAFRRIAFHSGSDDRTTVGVYVGPVDAPIPP